MTTYRTIHGDIVDLTTLTPQEAAFLARVVEVYRTGPTTSVFLTVIYGDDNPLLLGPHRFPDSVMWHPMVRVLHDLEYRIHSGQPHPNYAPEPDFA